MARSERVRAALVSGSEKRRIHLPRIGMVGLSSKSLSAILLLVALSLPAAAEDAQIFWEDDGVCSVIEDARLVSEWRCHGIAVPTRSDDGLPGSRITLTDTVGGQRVIESGPATAETSPAGAPILVDGEPGEQDWPEAFPALGAGDCFRLIGQRRWLCFVGDNAPE